jgi:hypothetical protein
MGNDRQLVLERLETRTLFETEPPEALFHYTDFDGAAGILQSRSLWMSKVSTLNDLAEVALAVRCFKERAVDRARRSERPVGEFLREVAESLDEVPRTNICVASFGEQDDQLEHWRSYANDGRGIAFGFRAAALRAAGARHDVRLLRCVYDEDLHRRIVDDLLRVLCESLGGSPPDDESQRRALRQAFKSLFLLTAPVIKDPHFAGEREWRLVSLPRSTDDPRLMAVLSGDVASVRLVLPLADEPPAPARVVSCITVGPTLEPENVADALHVMARRHAFDIPEVRFSRVPYRPRR